MSFALNKHRKQHSPLTSCVKPPTTETKTTSLCAPLLLIATLCSLFMFKFQEIKNSNKKTNTNDLPTETESGTMLAELINLARPQSGR